MVESKNIETDRPMQSIDSSLTAAINWHPPTIAANASLKAAIALLRETESPCLLVVEADSSRLVGSFSERDGLRFIGLDTDAMTQPVSTVISNQNLVLNHTDLQDIDFVLTLFQQHQISALPIINDQHQPVGLITANSLLKAIRHREQNDQNARSELQSEGNRALDELRKNEERWQLVIQASNDGIFDIDLTTGKGCYSKRFKQMLGYSDQEFAHTREQWLELLHPDDRDRVLATKEAYLRREIPQLTQEYRLRCKDGTYKWVLDRVLAVWDEAGNPIRVLGSSTDISDRKQLELALQASETKLNNILNKVPAAIASVRFFPNGTWIVDYRSAGYLQLFGLSIEEHAADSNLWMSQVHPQDLARYLTQLRADIEAGREGKIEYRFRHADGNWHWLAETYTVQWDEKANCWIVFMVDTDITYRKQAEEALRRQQTFLRNVIDTAPNLIFAKDWNGRFVLANKATAEIYGTTVENLIGKRDADFNPNLAEVEHFLETDRQVIRTRQPRLLDETVTSAAGETRDFQTIKKPIEAMDGQSILVLGVATDISDRKQSEAALAKRERYLMALVEIQRLLLASKNNQVHHNEILQQLGLASGASRVYLFENSRDEQGNLLMSQRAEWCAEGISPEINNPMLQNLSYQDFFPRWATALSQGTIINGVVADFPDSERFVLEPQGILAILILPLIVEGEFCGFIGFDNCVTARNWDSLEISLLSAAAFALSLYKEGKQAEVALSKLLVQTQEQSIALEKARDASEAANRAKSEFLANMSHELRTPLNAILGFTQIMSHDNLLSLRNREYLTIINRSGQHLLALINDVLEMSKIEAGRLKLQSASFDLYALLDTLYEMLYLKARTKQLCLTFEQSPNVPRYITTDEGKLRQVLLNLLGNGIKFTQKGGVTLRVSVVGENFGVRKNEGEQEHQAIKPKPSIASPDHPITLCFEVEDTGSGIAPQDLQRLFTPFVQIRTGQRPSEGTGLGLSISQKFVQLMGGTITVDSVVGQGSIFRFNIQATPAQTAQPPVSYPSQRVVSLVPGHPPYRVLIMEDHWENQQVLVNLLQPVGFDVQVASNGREGIILWESWRPHVVLMDIRMPVMNGYEATRQIRAREEQIRKEGNRIGGLPETTRIIAVTSSAFDEDRSAILKTGCDDFISKPFRAEEVFAKLAQHLNVQYAYETRDEIGEMISGYDDFDSSSFCSFREEQILDSSSLDGIPADWIAQLHQAAVLGKDRWILNLIGQLPDAHSHLAQGLKAWVLDFHFDKIVELIESLGHE
ncbi:PAS domain S-box protein [Leptothermofonsia sichuanensis E412]|uniref:PAS domain S-box protein n=1 Tax=Leptothermofonsia sichuanensis TaxID=2917832 RepID=UPI001CA6E7B8|nr:PAS domain S-box protein [Leptothermofonsia sichuanensis]QZZ19581.1 PAS domain S-box protein [Leptothermofonsia sichuanensis E412]